MATPPFLPDETKPADGDIVSQYPAVERLFRDIVEDWLLIDHDTDGEHTQVTLPELGADPSAVANTGFLYTKDDAADTELFYRDDSGNIVQITQDGGPGPQMAVFSSGTKLLFPQASAPTGWTKDTDQHDKALRIVNTSGGGAAGNTEMTAVFGSGKTAGATTLTSAQSGMPGHEHTYNKVVINVGSGVIGDSGFAANQPISAPTTGQAAGQNAASSHNHSLSLDLQYVDVIKATKD